MSAAHNLRILLITTGFLGLMPSYDFKTAKFRTQKIYCYILILLSLVLNGYSIYGKILKYYDSMSFLVLNTLSMIVTAFLNIFVVYGSTAWNLERIQALYDTFNKIDNESLQISYVKANVLKYVTWQFIAMQVFVVITAASDIYVWHFVLDDIEEYRYYFNDVLQIYYLTTMTLYQVNILMSVKRRYTLINDSIDGLDSRSIKVVNVRKSDESDLALKIKNVTKVHNNICDLVDLFNDLFGWHILLCILNIVISLLSSIDILLGKKNVSYANMALTVIWSIYVCIQGVLVATMCERVVDEGTKTIAVAYKTMHSLSNIVAVREKIYVLAQQASARCPQFTAAGFFTVDFSMLFTFVNLLTTYVIVIIQFSSTS